jgi:hypothetical protein
MKFIVSLGFGKKPWLSYFMNYQQRIALTAEKCYLRNLNGCIQKNQTIDIINFAQAWNGNFQLLSCFIVNQYDHPEIIIYSAFVASSG